MVDLVYCCQGLVTRVVTWSVRPVEFEIREEGPRHRGRRLAGMFGHEGVSFVELVFSDRR